MRLGSFYLLCATLISVGCFEVSGAAPRLAAQQPESHAKLTLLAEKSTRGQAVTTLGILFQLDHGWHIYWRNAGDSGEPPKVKWDLPPGLKAGDIRWPTPLRLGSGSVIDYGYEGQVLLMAPLERVADPKANTDTDAIGADVRYVVCREICIPGKAQLHAPKDRGDAQTQQLFAQTRRALPQKMPPNWRASATQDKDHFVLTVKTGEPVKRVAFFPLDASVIENSAPQEFAQVEGGFRLTLQKSEQSLKPADTLKGLIVLRPGKSYEIAAAVSRQ